MSEIDSESLLNDVMFFLFAGMDTTAKNVCSCILELARHPEERKKVVQEIEKIFGPDFEQNLTIDQIDRCERLNYFVKEVMRMRNSAF